MRIPKKTWNKYITDLRKISDKAAELMTSYLETHDVSSPAGRQQAIEYAYALATKYGEGTSALACEMYDSVVAASGKKLPLAEPAATATFNEVARTINGSMLYSKRPDVVGSSVGRLVKTAGVDTTMKNAIRDGAEWAWIQSGDSCAFCLALASQGWVKASEKVMKGNHAEHIHNNCDCTFSIRFDGKSSVEGYDPDALRRQYYAADGSTPTERINAMRRAQYAENKAAINAQKRLAYAERKQQNMPLARQAQAQYLRPAELKELENNDIIKSVKSHEELIKVIESLGIRADDSIYDIDLETGKHFVAGVAEIVNDFPKAPIRRLLVEAIEDEYGHFNYETLFMSISSEGLKDGIEYAFPTGAHEAGHAIDQLMSMQKNHKTDGYARDVVKRAIENLGLNGDNETLQKTYLSGDINHIDDDDELFCGAFERHARKKHCELSKEIIRIVKEDYDALYS